MATSVKIVFRKDKKNTKGEVPLYLRIIKGRKPKYIALGILVPEKYWDEENKRIKRGMENSQRLNNKIANKLADAENLVWDLEKKSKDISSSKIKDNIMGADSPSFFEYCKLYFMDVKGKIAGSTYDKAEGVINKLKDYRKGKDLTFEDLNTRFLKEYEYHMRNKKGNKNNTVFANMKIIRRIVNEAIKDDVIKIDQNPFLKYKCKWENVEKAFLTEEEIEKIVNMKLEPGTKVFNVRNAYILSAYAGGLRVSDICKLKWINYDGERIFLYTKKCKGVPVSIKLPPKAQEIIQCYYSENIKPNDFIFPFLDNNTDYSDEDYLTKCIDSQDTIINKSLKEIAEDLELNKHITFHSSRHTWATRALRKGMRIEYVSKLMGHSSIKTTQVYAKIVNEELDKAMDVFSEPEPQYNLKLA